MFWARLLQSPRTLICRLRPWALLVVAAGAVTLTLLFLNQRQPLSQWLFWRFAVIYGCVLLFGAACVSVGHAALGLLVKNRPLPLRERLLLDFAAGVLLFAIAVFLVGVCHGLGHASFWAIPGALLAVGLPRCLRDARRIAPHLAHHWVRSRPISGIVPALATGLGVVGLFLIYLSVLVPENLAFDSRWYHLAMAERFVAAGRIGAFPEGWFNGTQPHLASWLYTWAFTLPGFDLAERIVLSAHLEFLLFLATLAGVPLLVERLLPRSRVRGAWAATFLFPGIFLYDSSLGVAADHVLAFWAIPIALTAFRLVIAWTPSRGVLLGAMLAGAAMTKSQALYFLVPTALLLAGSAVVVLVRRTQRFGTLAKVLCLHTLGAFAVFGAPHYLANLIWYRNPIYPFMANVFPTRPWYPGHAGYSFDPGWTPEGTFWQRARETVLALFTFAYNPHDWPGFHRDLPVFGFLFTLSLVLLPFFPRARRTMLLALATLVGIAIWFWTYHQDRYLQTLLPWMVAVTVAAFTLAWRTGWPARLGLVALVAMQLIWGGDIPFLPTHAMAGRPPSAIAIDLLSTTFRHETRQRIDPHTGFDEVREALPKNSVVLLHDEYVQLGIGRPVVSDNPRWEGGLDLGKVGGPAQAFEQLRAYGVTHVLARPDLCRNGEVSLASEVVLHQLLQHWGLAHRRVGWLDLWALPERAPQASSSGPIVYAGCGRRAQVGLDAISSTYEEDRKATPEAARFLQPADEALFRGAQAAVIDERCPVPIPDGIALYWERVTHWRQAHLWLRRRGGSP